jgi:hypothetical protein
MASELDGESRQGRFMSSCQIAHNQSARFHGSISHSAEDFGIEIPRKYGCSHVAG